jgi:predicted P-loop ATPase
VRKAFRRNHEDIQRIAVLGGTSNEEMVINDVTGNRRIIPINVTKFDIEKFKKIDKNQLWAEVYHQWNADKNAWMLNQDSIKLLNISTVDNMDVSVEEELVSRYFKPKQKEDDIYENMTTTDVASYLTRASEMKFSLKRLGIILKKFGFNPISKKVNGKAIKVYEIIKVQQGESELDKKEEIREDEPRIDPIFAKTYKEVKEKNDIIINKNDEDPF